MVKLDKFFKKKKVFITGHTGFKGSWLAETLITFGSNVKGYSLHDDKVKYYKKFINYKKIKNIYGDVSDYKKLRKEILNFKPDIIFHLAAQPLVIEGYKNPYQTFKSNCLGVINILDISKELKFLKSIIIVTTDKCYKINKGKKIYKENDELGGLDPYSASKAAAELIYYPYKNFLDKNKIGSATVRAGNVIGGGDFSENRIIPDCYKALDNRLLILRNPKSIRPWQHILDVINGYLILSMWLCFNPKKYSGSWNFGPSEKEKTVKKVAEEFRKNSKTKFKIKILKKRKDYKESEILKLDSNKAKKYLNWKQNLNFKNMLRITVDWYTQYYLKRNCKVLTQSQIKKFFNIY